MTSTEDRLADARRAGRNTIKVEIALAKGTPVPANARWRELCKETDREIRVARQMLNNWAKEGRMPLPGRRSRWQHVARVGERIRRQTVGPQGQQTRHWYAWRLKRWLGLLGLGKEFPIAVQRDIDSRKRKPKESESGVG